MIALFIAINSLLHPHLHVFKPVQTAQVLLASDTSLWMVLYAISLLMYGLLFCYIRSLYPTVIAEKAFTPRGSGSFGKYCYKSPFMKTYFS